MNDRRMTPKRERKFEKKKLDLCKKIKKILGWLVEKKNK